METVEAFCADHTVEIDEVLYGWPASKFEAFYLAFTKRKIADELVNRRMGEIAALWGNPNLDNEKDPELRSNIMRKIESRYNEAIERLYNPKPEEEEDDIDWDDPFFAPLKKDQELPQGPTIDDLRSIDQFEDE